MDTKELENKFHYLFERNAVKTLLDTMVEEFKKSPSPDNFAMLEQAMLVYQKCWVGGEILFNAIKEVKF